MARIAREITPRYPPHVTRWGRLRGRQFTQTGVQEEETLQRIGPRTPGLRQRWTTKLSKRDWASPLEKVDPPILFF